MSDRSVAATGRVVRLAKGSEGPLEARLRDLLAAPVPEARRQRRDALRRHKASAVRTRVGLAPTSKRIARQGCPVLSGNDVVGHVTSGTFSPTLQRSLAMAIVPKQLATVGSLLNIDVRGAVEQAEVVPLPFYKTAPR